MLSIFAKVNKKVKKVTKVWRKTRKHQWPDSEKDGETLKIRRHVDVKQRCNLLLHYATPEYNYHRVKEIDQKRPKLSQDQDDRTLPVFTEISSHLARKDFVVVMLQWPEIVSFNRENQESNPDFGFRILQDSLAKRSSSEESCLSTDNSRASRQHFHTRSKTSLA